ncbi:hypothetical protein [Streptomyces halobius]|uniref:hypothetical protein n=1 Tax=Streptomyces halobius TaxID=2879846 RepID=UPI0029E7EA9A|nr:hypothetical protein [Streptomyces halobius]
MEPFTDEREAGLGFESVFGVYESGVQLVDPMAQQPVGDNRRVHCTAGQALG